MIAEYFDQSRETETSMMLDYHFRVLNDNLDRDLARQGLKPLPGNEDEE